MTISRLLICLLISFGLSAPAFAQTPPDFSAWVEAFKREARAEGISDAVLDDAFANVHAPEPKIIKNDHTQPEQTRSFAAYANAVVTPKKIAEAKALWQTHQALFHRIEDAYGVPAPYLLALWGIESNFGKHQGTFSIVQALTTLSYDGRRAVFFRKELMHAMHILQDEHIPAAQLTGSWAGAMGQDQFMPSSFLAFAVDFDGDGRRDIWTSEPDALASMANYLHRKGWNASYGWGAQVWLPVPGNPLWVKLQKGKTKLSLSQWKAQGVLYAQGEELPESSLPARLVMPDDNPHFAFLVFPDYDVVMDWNRSTYFATTVGLFADAIAR